MFPLIGLGDDGFESFGQRDEDDLDTDHPVSSVLLFLKICWDVKLWDSMALLKPV